LTTPYITSVYKEKATIRKYFPENTDFCPLYIVGAKKFTSCFDPSKKEIKTGKRMLEFTLPLEINPRKEVQVCRHCPLTIPAKL